MVKEKLNSRQANVYGKLLTNLVAVDFLHVAGTVDGDADADGVGVGEVCGAVSVYICHVVVVADNNAAMLLHLFVDPDSCYCYCSCSCCCCIVLVTNAYSIVRMAVLVAVVVAGVVLNCALV